MTFAQQIDPRSEVELLRRSLEGSGNGQQLENLKNFRSYVFGREDAWVLSSTALPLIKDVLVPPAQNGPEGTDRVRLMRVFAHCALKEEFCGLLSTDRKDNGLMCYISRFPSMSVEEQKAVALYLCHTSSHASGRQALLYFSSWSDSGGRMLNNAHITTSAAKECLQSYNPCLRDYGIALIFNLSLKFSSGEQKTCFELLRSAEELVEDLVNFLQALKCSLSPKSQDLRLLALQNLS